MPKQKKLYIIRKEFDGFGGAENVAKRYVESFSKFYNTSLVYAGCELEGAKITGDSGPGWFKALSFASSVNKFLSSRKDSLVFSMSRGVHGNIFRMGDGVHRCWLRRKKTSRLKEKFNLTNLITPILEQKSIEKSRFVVSNSKLVANETQSEYQISPSKLKVIHNGYSPNRYFHVDETKKKTMKIKYGLSDSGINLLFCANGWKRKGLYHCLRLLKEIDSATPYNLWVIGKGDPAIYTETIDSLGVSDQVTFYGSVEDTSPWYQMADLFVLPTIYDPFSNSSLEAIACGCPVLTTASNGASECVNPQNGLVVSSPELVYSKLSLDWIKSIDGINRLNISSSVKHLSLEDEVGAYLNIFDSHE